jgi:ion channel POLLUX/CASTOR
MSEEQPRRERGARRKRLIASVSYSLRRLRFEYERFLALRGSSIYILLLFAFFLVYLALFGLYAFLLKLSGQHWQGEMSLGWHVFLELLSPARLSNSPEPSPLLKLLSIITTLIGIGFLSTLIAYTTATTTNIIRSFRRGLSKVPEVNHTLILGFDERVVDIIKELGLSNQSKRALPVVVLSDREKQEVDERLGARAFRTPHVRLSVARGEATNDLDLRRVNSREARSAIILARCHQTASKREKQASDAVVLQTIKSLYANQEPSRRYPIVAEIFDQARRELISGLDPKIISVDSNRFLASMLVQSAITPGLERVYQELLSFDMSELYFYEVPSGYPFGELVFHFEDGVPIGYQDLEGQVHLLPPDDHELLQGEYVILIATDDHSIRFSEERLYYPKFRSSQLDEHEPDPKRVLLVGWHYLAPRIFEECLNRLPPGSELTVMVPDTPTELSACLHRSREGALVNVRHVPLNPFCREDLCSESPFSYDTVILLSQSGSTETEEQMDADTLMLILLMRRIREGLPLAHVKARVVTQLFRAENLRLIEPDDGVAFVQTSQVGTSLLTQLSEEEDLLRAYNHLFLQRQCALGLKPIELYLDDLSEPVRFIDLFGAAMSHHEVCVGVKTSDPSVQGAPYFGVYVNPPKERAFQMQAGDMVIVLFKVGALHHH